MKFLLTSLVAFAQISFANELELSFKTNNLNHSFARAKATLISTNPVCSSIAVGIGGVGIKHRYKFIDSLIYTSNDELTIVTNYQPGGFCNYQLYEIYLYFVENQNTYFEVRLNIIDKEEWSGGALQLTELSSNQNEKIVIQCEGKKNVSLSNCLATNNGRPNGRGNVGNLYLWEQNLRETDAYFGGELIFIEKN